MATASGFAASAADGGGTNPWFDPANAEGAPDGVATTVPGGIGGFTGNTLTDALMLGATATTVPAGSSITEISWTLFREDVNGVTSDSSVILEVTDGTNTWTTSAFSGTAWPTTYGPGQAITGNAGSNGLPGTMITASGTLIISVAMIATAPAFGVGGNPQVDAGGWLIAYTPPATPPLLFRPNVTIPDIRKYQNLDYW